MLDQLAEALAATLPRPTESMIASSIEHGNTRFHQSYNVNEVMIEFSLLRRAVFECVAARLGRDLHPEEDAALNQGVDTAARQAVVSFCDDQTRSLQQANEQQSKYLSFLSHDLRGGLNGIFLMIEVLKREMAGHAELAETVNDLDMMRRSILETVATMDRFLHAERFRKGKVAVKRAPLNLDVLLGEIGAQYSYQAKEKGIQLEVETPRPAKTVSDRELLSMILQNLVSNAVKYTSRGRVWIRARQLADCGDWQVEVQDEGPGIASDKLSKLFDSFTRGETHGQAGVGLGLNIAHQAATVLGAKLWAESVPGTGATFIVRLPEGTAAAT